ncbi:histidine phosphatase family protein [Paenibacillus sp. XY044]|uniref:histidine phosphatase family protein n=1 Tax=Paenibacillus sp. XY044 TaxID=2026089 RepID=UPI00211B5F18|nr:histidine phosphatase family protein [Paenibacillus sp. XY044]
MIYVVRHGQTDLNKEGRLQGRRGLPLNAYGIQQAEALRDELKEVHFDYVFSSPQVRAIQTAEIISGLKSLVERRIDVFDLGDADLLRREVLWVSLMMVIY